MKTVFIVNPVSGKQNPGCWLEKELAAYRSARPDFSATVYYTGEKGEAEKIARRYGEAGQETRIYAVGGDGTLNEVFHGAYAYPHLAVGAFPFGTGNDFVRNFGPVAAFLNFGQQMEASPIPIDLLETDKGICTSITSVGLDAEVAYGIPKFRRLPFFGGVMAYNASILQRLLKPLGQQLQINIDGKEIEGCFLIATVCNGAYYGGGYFAAPVSRMDDGLLDVILVKKLSRLLIANIIGKYKKGHHFEGAGIAPPLQKYFAHYTGTRVVVKPQRREDFILNIDGECEGAPRLCAKVLPLAARFLLPPRQYQAYQGVKEPER